MIAKPITTLRDLASDYLIEHSNTDRGAERFIYALVSFEKYLGRLATLNDLSTAALSGYMALALTTLADSTATYYRRRIITLWWWAHKTGLVTVAPSSRGIGFPTATEVERERKRDRARRGTKFTSQTPRQWPFPGPAAMNLAKPSRPVGPPEKAAPEMSLRDYFNSYYLPMKLSGCAVNTRRLYLNSLGLFDKYLGRPATLADLNDETVTAHLGWIVSRGCSPRTANKSRDQLLAVWRYSARKRHVELFPDVEPVKEYKRAPIAWTMEQLGRLLDAARAHGTHRMRRQSLCGIPFDVWWVALLLTQYDTGLRIGAAMQLRCDDYDPAQQRLFVRAEIQKQRADQVLPVSGETAAALALCLKGEQRATLFPWPYSMGTLYNHLERMLAAAKLPTGRRDKFHKIRRTSATQAELALGPGSATRHLGHSSPRVTEGYLDRSMLPAANVATSLPRPPAADPKGGAA